MSILQQVTEWPVDNVAASLIVGDDMESIGDLDHVFELASVTKLLSAYGVLLAVEEGVFELATPLGPEGSTVRHLLAHASGVGFDSRKPQKKVGERRIYSSAGFEILAEAVEQEAGMTFAEYLKLGVFSPLGMDSTELYGPAGHGARSSVTDMSVFAQELLNPQLLHESTLVEAFSVQFPDLEGVVPGFGPQRPNQWGLGFEIRGTKDPHWTGQTMPASLVGHFGVAGTFLWVEPKTKRAMVVLTDRDFGDWAKPLWSKFNDQVWESLDS
ncbi:serine hydrolase domain-containing protein [Corynebacterium alimapuense]|uniref:Serine hydrolase n=1 Tax=Corynebacterium alimapuense TaxID=1576874 RepID=A0A3M8K8R9_9CORY|nr:serine hydrolase domain-containing protein [Corynebacterium alimapuense]RNE49570.1 serine hydrolase [Corynebacterium alimapuense]